MRRYPQPEARSSKPVRTLSIGGATFDLFLDLSSDLTHDCHGVQSFAFPLGAKININNVIGTCGGGANNTAIGLSRLGCHAAFSGVFGDDQWGQEIARTMEREHVDMRYVSIIEHEPSSFSLILQSKTGERTILSHKSMDRHFHDVIFDREAAASVEAVYLNHIHEDACEIENDLIHILVSTPSIHLTWNPGGCQIDAGLNTQGNRDLLQATHVLLLNKEEALKFTKTESIRMALQTLIDAGVQHVCITDGAHGSYATDGNHIYFCPSPPCTVVDTTGAGDAFGTGVTWALLTGKTLPIALKAGTINAVSVVGSIGAQHGLLTNTQIETALANSSLNISVEPLSF